MALMLLIINIVNAIEPTQQFNKIYLSPFYRDSLSLNTNYTYTLTVNPPDKITNVLNAILSFNAQINGQTQTFTLWVNGKSCNNPTYSVATAFSTTGNVQFYFDCSNVITQAGNYNITLRSAVNTGTVQGWLDLTYMNKPMGSVSIKGTDYNVGERGTTFLQLQNEFGDPVSGGSCSLSVYYPNRFNTTHPIWLNNSPMLYLNDGIYYYDFFVPSIPGVYIVDAYCSYVYSSSWFYNPDYYPYITSLNPIENISIGTGLNQSNLINSYTDWLYDYVDSDANKVIQVSYQWNNITNYVDLTNITRLSVYWMGESSKAITLYFWLYNWSSSKYNSLSSVSVPITTTTGSEPTGFDVLYTVQVSSSNISHYINNGRVKVLLNATTGTGFRVLTNWLNIKLDAPSGTITSIKGNGEIKVNSPYGTDTTVITLGDKITGTTYFDGSPYEYWEGTVSQNITVLSQATSNQYNTTFSFVTPYKIDCTAILEFQKWNGTVWNDATNDIATQAYGGGTENCEVTVSLTEDIIGTYYYRINYDNYQEWQVKWDYSVVNDTYNLIVNPICSYYGTLYGYNFTVPILYNTTVSSNYYLDYCHRLYDDYYFATDFYLGSLTAPQNEYESYVIELDVYYESFFRKSTSLWNFYVKGTGTANSSSEVLTCLKNGNCPSWWINTSFKNLTDYNSIVTSYFNNLMSNDTLQNQYLINLLNNHTLQNGYLTNLMNNDTLQNGYLINILNNHTLQNQYLLNIMNNQTFQFSNLTQFNALMTLYMYNLMNNDTLQNQYLLNIINNNTYWFGIINATVSNSSNAQIVALLNTIINNQTYHTGLLTMVLNNQTYQNVLLLNIANNQTTNFPIFTQYLQNIINNQTITNANLGWILNNQSLQTGYLINLMNNHTLQNSYLTNVLNNLSYMTPFIIQTYGNTTYYLPLINGNLSALDITQITSKLNIIIGNQTIQTGYLINVMNNQTYYNPLFLGFLENIKNNQTYWYPLFDASLTNIKNNQTYWYPLFQSMLLNIVNNESYYFSQLNTSLYLIPSLTWNYNNRTLTYTDTNQSFAQAIYNCMQTGVCGGWWIDNQFVYLNQSNLQIYGLLQSVSNNQTYYYPLLNGNINTIQNNQTYYYPLFNGLLDNILYNVTYWLPIINDTIVNKQITVDWQTGQAYIWNYSNRQLTATNQSVSLLIQDCLQNGNCPSWWVNTTLTNISQEQQNLYTQTISIFNILTNMVDNVWNYTGRYIHGIIN